MTVKCNTEKNVIIKLVNSKLSTKSNLLLDRITGK